MEQQSLSRRNFLRAGWRAETAPVRPPGVREQALSACTGCGECVRHCPAGIVSLADGLAVVDLSAGECTFCGACAENCPEPVFTEERAGRFDHVIAIAASCLPFHGVDCQACRDACPTGAIRFRPRRGGPFVPELAAASCTGCGACIAICPVGATAVASRPVEVVYA